MEEVEEVMPGGEGMIQGRRVGEMVLSEDLQASAGGGSASWAKMGLESLGGRRLGAAVRIDLYSSLYNIRLRRHIKAARNSGFKGFAEPPIRINLHPTCPSSQRSSREGQNQGRECESAHSAS